MNLSGFRGTPLTRLIIFTLFITSILVSLTSTKHYFHLQLRPHLLHYHQFSRVFLWQTIYANSGELLFACAVLYNLRVVERMFGTRKWASFLVVSWIWTSLLGVMVLGMVNAFVGWWWGRREMGLDGEGDVDGEGLEDWISGGEKGWGGGWNYLPPGPTAVVFAALAQYHAAVPSIYNIRFLPSLSSPSPSPSSTAPATTSTASTPTSSSSSTPPEDPSSTTTTSSTGITVTDKLPIYILASQLAFSQPPGSLLAAAVGWLFGYAYRAEVVPGSRWRVPGWLFDRSGGEYENLRRRLAAGEFAGPEERGDGEGVGTGAATGTGTGTGGVQQRRPLMGQILDQFRGAF